MNYPRRVPALVLLGGVFVMEGYDINAMALAVPRLEGALGLVPTSFGLVFTALLVGIGIGGALLAPFGDRFGRRLLIVLGCLATGLCTLATTTADTVGEFLVWRGLTGIALGAALPNVSALSAELAPGRWKATMMALVSAGIPLGLALAGLMAPEVVALAGWQGLFLVPGVFALGLAAALQILLDPALPPDAPARRRADSAAGAAGAAGAKAAPAAAGAKAAPGSPGAKAAPAAAGPAPARSAAPAPQLELFRLPWLIPFAVFAAMLSLNAMNLYLLNSWIPTVLPQAGFAQNTADRISGIVQLAGLAIGIAASLGIDRWRPSATLVALFGAMALCFLGVSLTAPAPLLWTLLLCVGVGGASAGGMALPSLCAYLFAPRLLSTAIGLGVLVARIGAFAGPVIGQALLNASARPQSFFLAAAIPALACALVALLVPWALRVRGLDEARDTGAPTAPLAQEA